MDEEHQEPPLMSLTGFMFGNIDESGRLEDDFLDEESKDRLTSLSTMGITSFIEQVTFSDASESKEEDNESKAMSDKSESAIDFSDINELAEEECIEDCPSRLEFDEKMDTSKKNKLNTPLAALLPPELADVDVKEMFPEFRPGQVLRFSRLFKAAHVPHIWKKKKKKSLSQDSNSNGQDINIENMDSNKCHKSEYGGNIKADSGRAARVDEIVTDDRILLMKPLNQTGSDGSNSESSKRPDVAPWRYGPARLWYDMLKVPSNGEGFDYGFKLKQQSSEEAKVSTIDFPQINQDAFYMITQLHWEDDVIWNAEDAKNKMQSNAKLRAATAGWIPSLTTRTMQQYLQQNDPQVKLDPNASIFPVENQALVHGRWEDDVIWDAQAMDRIPEPPVVILDPDDEDLILEIPDDDYDTVRQPSDSLDSSATSANKKEKSTDCDSALIPMLCVHG